MQQLYFVSMGAAAPLTSQVLVYLVTQKNLAAAQVSNVDLVIKKLPVITNMAEHVESMPDFKVSAGYSAETSGGIMAMLEASKADDFIAELEQDFGQKAWIIGEVTNGQKEARIAPDVEILSLSDSFMLK